MKIHSLLLAALGCLALLGPAQAQVSVLTQHNDNQRTGANLSETTLTTGNVNQTQFGKLFSLPVDGEIYAQPLYVPSVAIPGQGTHNVVFVCTMHNSAYAWDADDPNQTAPLWTRNFGPTVPAADVQCCCTDISSEIGILSTPVVDAGTSTLYLLARNKNADGTYHQWLHALNLTTGADKANSPVEITATVSGNGDGANGGSLSFNPKTQNQRPALTLANGNVYLAWASHNDCGPYHGWLIGYDKTTLAQTAVFCATPNGGLGGIWQAGQGPAVDASGNLYVMTGNGTFDGNQTGGTNYGDSFLKISPSGTLLDWFTPFNEAALNAADDDLGSAGVLLLPGTNLLVGGGKEGKLYLLDHSTPTPGGTKMGHYHAGSDNQIVQSFAACNGHLHGSPIYWNSATKGRLVYVWSENDFLKAFSFNGATFQTTPLMQSTIAVPGGMPGAMMSISANGNAAGSGIVWTSHPLNDNANNKVVDGIFRAFDANDVTTELWNSKQNVARDDVGKFAKFCPPTVANGKVYLATFSGELLIYGLNPPAPVPAPVISPNGGASTDLITLSDPLAGAAIRYTSDGSAPTALSTLYTAPFRLNRCATLKVRAFKSGYAPSAIVSAFFGGGGATGLGDGLKATYFKQQDLTGGTVQRIDSTVDFDWGDGSPDAAIPSDNFSARWTGQVQARSGGLHTFYVTIDDGARLWVNNQLIIDSWVDQGPTEHSGTITLSAGQFYDIRLEYYENGGGAVCQLAWSNDCLAKAIVPQSQLYSVPPPKPSVGITVPAANAWLNQLPQVAGTASANNGSSISGVTLRVRRSNGNDYWTGAAWGAVTNLPTTLAGANWTAPAAGSSLPGGANLVSSTYTLTATATDTLNLTNSASITVRVNKAMPTVAITQPAAAPNNNYQKLIQVKGTAGDSGGSGLQKVTVVLRRPAGGGSYQYWNGAAWDAAYSTTNELPATGTTNWGQTLPALAQGAYEVRATASDGAGNATSSAYAPFRINTTPPTASVTTPAPAPNNVYASLAQAAGTASAAGGSPLKQVAAVLRRRIPDAPGVPAHFEFWISGTTWSGTYSNAAEHPVGTASNWTLPLPPLARGAYGVRVSAADRAGNTVIGPYAAFTITGP